jgi:hypothetical protein
MVGPCSISGLSSPGSESGFGDTCFHWITDVLPRLGLARRAGYNTASFDWVLVNGLTHPFQQETLEHIGISKKRCLSLNKTELAYEIEEALLSSLQGVPGLVPAETVEFLQSTFPTKKIGAGRKIFIGRGGGASSLDS